MKYPYVLSVALLLSACDPAYDMHGVDPRVHYLENPVANTLETRESEIWIPFAGNNVRMEDKDSVRAKLDAINPMAIEEAILVMHPSQVKNTKRISNFDRLLRSTGVDVPLGIASSPRMQRNEGQLQLRYAIVQGPHCPDWRTSPVTTYSNTSQGNIGCSSVYNLGRMAADPHDLVQGSGVVQPDANYTSTTIQNYRSGAAAGGQ